MSKSIKCTDQHGGKSQKYWKLKSVQSSKSRSGVAPSPYVINGVHGGNISIVYLMTVGFIRKIQNQKIIPKDISKLCLKYYYIPNKIIYSTYYCSYLSDENDCGIFEYDLNEDKKKIITLWKDINYYPQEYSVIYHQQKLIFVGGKDGKSKDYSIGSPVFGYNSIMEYDLTAKTFTKIAKINNASQPPHLYIGQDENLNILNIFNNGRNKFHLKWNFESKKMMVINDTFVGGIRDLNHLYGCGVMEYSKKNQIISMGGKIFLGGNVPVFFDDIYFYNSNKLEWTKHTQTLPQRMSNFGHCIFKHFVLIFGGLTNSDGRHNAPISSIYCLNLLESSSWIKSKIECPEPERLDNHNQNHAVIINDIVHIINKSNAKHFSISIFKLFPFLYFIS